MKSKTYWKKESGDTDPFKLPKQLRGDIAAAAQKFSESESGPPTVKYVWLYVTENGLAHGRGDEEVGEGLEFDTWLNIIDESASLGAEWLVMYVGTDLSKCPQVWDICKWAQETHGIKVGIHLEGAHVSNGDFEHLADLDASKLFLAVDEDRLESLAFLEERGIRLCRANVPIGERPEPDCKGPATMTCVGANGSLYACGLVLGRERYALGNVQARPLKGIMEDQSLPHVVHRTLEEAEAGCDGCPAQMAKRFVDLESA